MSVNVISEFRHSVSVTIGKLLDPLSYVDMLFFLTVSCSTRSMRSFQHTDWCLSVVWCLIIFLQKFV